MKKNKEIYSQPTSKLLVVRFERVICQSIQYGAAGHAGDDLGLDDDDYDFGSF